MEAFSRAKCNRIRKKNRKLKMREVNMRLDISMLNPTFMHTLLGTFGWHARFFSSKDPEFVPSSRDAETMLFSSKESEFVPSPRDSEFVPSSKDSEFVPSSMKTEFVPSSKEIEFVPSSKESEFVPSSKDNKTMLFSSKKSEIVPSSKKSEIVPSSKKSEFVPWAKVAPLVPDDIYDSFNRLKIERGMEGIPDPILVKELISEVARTSLHPEPAVGKLLQEVLKEAETVCVKSHIYYANEVP